jgi:hypothetical protein
MSLLIACFREAQPGRVAEVRQAVQTQPENIQRGLNATGAGSVMYERAGR